MVQVSTKAEWDAALINQDAAIEVAADIDVDVLPTYLCKVTVHTGGCLYHNQSCYTSAVVGTVTAYFGDWPEDVM